MDVGELSRLLIETYGVESMWILRDERERVGDLAAKSADLLATGQRAVDERLPTAHLLMKLFLERGDLECREQICSRN